MKTDHVQHLIHDYLDGELSEDLLRMVGSHLDACPSCRREADGLRRLISGLQGLSREIEPPEHFLEDLPLLPDRQPVEPGSFGFRRFRDNGSIPSPHFPTSGSTVFPYRLPVVITRVAAVFALLFCAGMGWLIFGPTSPENDRTGNPPNGPSELTITGISPETTGVRRVQGEPVRSPAPTMDGTEGRKRSGDDRGSQETVLAHREVPETSSVVPPATPGSRSKDAMAPAAAPSMGKAVPEVAGKPAGTLRTGILRGIVTDQGTGAELFGVNLHIVGTTRGATTDPNGTYSIIGLPVGNYTLRASAIGYEPISSSNVVLSDGDTLTLNIRMLTEQVPIAGVTITADQQLVNSQATSGTRTVQPSEVSKAAIESIPNTGPETRGILRRSTTGDYSKYSVTPDATAPGSESYENLAENGFHDASEQPTSTFSIDVDAASYTNIRRFINQGRRPPKDAVRIEEMVNYFTYDYPQPERGRPFSVTTDLARCPWNAGNLLLLVGIQGKSIAAEDLPPGNLVFLIDVSGSMKSDNKLPLLRSAFRLLVNQLREEDRITIVVYAGSAGLVLPPTSGADKKRILAAIDGLEAGGSTAGGAGIRLAYSQARESFIESGNNRVILATDGDFNVGLSSDDEMVRLIEQERDDGIFLSVLGFGTGNLKDSKMEKLADRGNGNYSYIDNIQEAKRVFVGQLSGTLYTIAKDVKIQMEFDPDRVSSYRLIGYENRVMRNRDFRDDRKDAGELGAGHSVTALYEIVPVDKVDADDAYAGSDDRFRGSRRGSAERARNAMGTVSLRYKDPDATRSRELLHTIGPDGPRNDGASENLRFAAAVAGFGLMLADSEFRGTVSYRLILGLAADALGRDPGGYRGEFIRLVESFAELYGRD